MSKYKKEILNLINKEEYSEYKYKIILNLMEKLKKKGR